MNLYFVKHESCFKPFLFTGSDGFEPGDEVVCETHKGEKRGKIVCALRFITESTAQYIGTSCGAYWPLAKVLRKYVRPVVTSVDDVPDHIKQQIILDERHRIWLAIEAGQIRDKTLPFDV